MTFINPRELGARWRVSTKTLERWRNEGCGPAYMKLHGRVLYRVAADQPRLTVVRTASVISLHPCDERISPFVGADSLVRRQFTIHAEIGSIEANNFAGAVGPLQAKEERLQVLKVSEWTVHRFCGP